MPTKLDLILGVISLDFRVSNVCWYDKIEIVVKVNIFLTVSLVGSCGIEIVEICIGASQTWFCFLSAACLLH